MRGIRGLAFGREAWRLIEGGGARMDDEAVTDAGRMLAPSDLSEPLKLSAGRKKHAVVRLG